MRRWFFGSRPVLRVKTETPPDRCEVCHQPDFFNPLTNYCSRCTYIVKETGSAIGPEPKKKKRLLAKPIFYQLVVASMASMLMTILTLYFAFPRLDILAVELGAQIIFCFLLSNRIFLYLRRRQANWPSKGYFVWPDCGRWQRIAVIMTIVVGALVGMLFARGYVFYRYGTGCFSPALILAADKGDAATVTTLLIAGADAKTCAHPTVTANGDGHAEFHRILKYALEEGHPELITVRNIKDAELYAGDKGGCTVLTDAIENGYTDIVRALIFSGANVNVRNRYGRTALTEAADRGNAEMVKILLKAGADANATDHNCKTALSYALEKNNIEIIEMLK
jgi:hypothetical protein